MQNVRFQWSMEGQVKQRNVWGNKILTDAGKISAEQAKLYTETEFEKYRIVQDRMFVSDYDKFLLELEEKVKE